MPASRPVGNKAERAAGCRRDVSVTGGAGGSSGSDRATLDGVDPGAPSDPRARGAVSPGVSPDCVCVPRRPPARHTTEPLPTSGIRGPPPTPTPMPRDAPAPVGCAGASVRFAVHGALSRIHRAPPTAPIRSHHLPTDHSTTAPHVLGPECAAGAGGQSGPLLRRSSTAEPRSFLGGPGGRGRKTVLSSCAADSWYGPDVRSAWLSWTVSPGRAGDPHGGVPCTHWRSAPAVA